jgi:hypothetical protein
MFSLLLFALIIIPYLIESKTHEHHKSYVSTGVGLAIASGIFWVGMGLILKKPIIQLRGGHLRLRCSSVEDRIIDYGNIRVIKINECPVDGKSLDIELVDDSLITLTLRDFRDEKTMMAFCKNLEKIILKSKI